MFIMQPAYMFTLYPHRHDMIILNISVRAEEFIAAPVTLINGGTCSILTTYNVEEEKSPVVGLLSLGNRMGSNKVKNCIILSLFGCT